jgi:hypothetical protein
MTGSSGHPVRRGLSVQSLPASGILDLPPKPGEDNGESGDILPALAGKTTEQLAV